MLRQARDNLRIVIGNRLRTSHKPGRNITAVPVALRMDRVVFLPQNQQADPGRFISRTSTAQSGSG